MVRSHNSRCRRERHDRFHDAHTTATLIAFFLGLEDLDEFLIVVVQIALKPFPVDQPNT